MELNREKEYTQEAADLIRSQREGTPELEVLERLFRLGVWSRGSTLPRGTLFVSAAARLSEDLIATLLQWLAKHPADAAGHKVLLAIGQWAGPNCFDALQSVIRKAGKDTETLYYCISALRFIGGPRAGDLLVDLMKIPDERVQKEAISSVMDLATGGSVSDTDSAASVPLSPPQPLEELLHLRLGQTLDRLRQSSSLSLALRLRAEEAMAWLVRNGFLIPVDAPATAAASNFEAIRAYLPDVFSWAWSSVLNVVSPFRGGPEEDKTVSYMPVSLKGRESRAVLAIHPLPAPEGADVLVPGIFYLSVNKRLVANIGLREDPLPEKVTALRVSVALGESEVDAHGEPLILKPGEQSVAEFAIPEDSLRAWCNQPTFVATPVPTEATIGGFSAELAAAA
ncbi:MAG TPA: HEAT repeat domain-containing protein [Bryobacteraceae bacterium]|jgi:hypothetical protein|nr:HEAT repeat domain-containing protein [Bryobacteraceae bacterium]